MNTEAKRAISERFKAACEREGLNYSEAARLLGLKNSVYGPHISNEKSFNKASNEAWETVKAWTNSGETLRRYGAKHGNSEKPESELPKTDKSKTVKTENDKPPVWHTINDNPDIPEWAKQQALRDIEQMPEKANLNESDLISGAINWGESNSDYRFWFAIDNGIYDSIPAPKKWLIPENMIPDQFKEKKEDDKREFFIAARNEDGKAVYKNGSLIHEEKMDTTKSIDQMTDEWREGKNTKKLLNKYRLVPFINSAGLLVWILQEKKWFGWVNTSIAGSDKIELIKKAKHLSTTIYL